MGSNSPPLSPVIYSSRRQLRTVQDVAGQATSTPLPGARPADKKATIVRRSLDMDEIFPDDDFPEAALMSPLVEPEAVGRRATEDADGSRRTNSQLKNDSSFLKAVMASSFGENAADKKAAAAGKENESFPSAFFDVSSFDEKSGAKPANDASLYSATQLVQILDRSVPAKTPTKISSKTPTKISTKSPTEVKMSESSNKSSSYSLDDLPPLKFGTSDRPGVVCY